MGAAALLGGAAIGGGLISSAGQLIANSQNASIAREQMRFQEYMSSTAHQREVKDLIAAGLNPILSATGGHGASTPSGATATMQNPGTGAQQGLSDAARGLAIDLPRIQNESKMVEANSAKADADRRNTDADTILKLQGADRNDMVTQKLRNEIANIEQSTRTSSAQEAESRQRSGRIEQETEILKVVTPFIKRGGAAINQLIDYATKGAPLGNAAANVVEAVQNAQRKVGRAVEDTKATAIKILDTVKKHFTTTVNSASPNTPAWDDTQGQAP